MSIARSKLDWDKMFSLTFDREKAVEIRGQFTDDVSSCTMCGPLCVYIILDRFLEVKGDA